VLRRLPPSSFLVVLAATLLLATVAQASGVAVATRAVQSIFFIAKSENKNQVHYGIRLDEACSPAGDSPMFAYWRMLERGPFAQLRWPLGVDYLVLTGRAIADGRILRERVSD
jgi:hypothetical protein